MKDELIGQVAIYLSWIFVIGTALLFMYSFFTGDTSFIMGGGTADDCIPNYMGSCDP